MSPIVQLRKEPRMAGAGPLGRGAQIASTHISPFVQGILGLKREETVVDSHG
jgi:hypothetical protein